MTAAEEIAKEYNAIVEVVKDTRAQCGSKDELTRSQVEFLRQLRDILCK